MWLECNSLPESNLQNSNNALEKENLIKNCGFVSGYRDVQLRNGVLDSDLKTSLDGWMKFVNHPDKEVWFYKLS